MMMVRTENVVVFIILFLWLSNGLATSRSVMKPPPGDISGNQCYGQFEEYSRCGAACFVGCDNPNIIISCANCTAGCVCKSGYLRQFSTDRYSSCIERSQCPPTSKCTNVNSQFQQCMPSCTETCNGTSCLNLNRCDQGCVCKPGYVKFTNAANAQCVLKTRCNRFFG